MFEIVPLATTIDGMLGRMTQQSRQQMSMDLKYQLDTTSPERLWGDMHVFSVHYITRDCSVAVVANPTRVPLYSLDDRHTYAQYEELGDKQRLELLEQERVLDEIRDVLYESIAEHLFGLIMLSLYEKMY